ncbi:MAG: hypothetical protein SGILL_000693 [Bacillariaceae sp.]
MATDPIFAASERKKRAKNPPSYAAPTAASKASKAFKERKDYATDPSRRLKKAESTRKNHAHKMKNVPGYAQKRAEAERTRYNSKKRSPTEGPPPGSATKRMFLSASKPPPGLAAVGPPVGSATKRIVLSASKPPPGSAAEGLPPGSATKRIVLSASKPPPGSVSGGHLQLDSGSLNAALQPHSANRFTVPETPVTNTFDGGQAALLLSARFKKREESWSEKRKLQKARIDHLQGFQQTGKDLIDKNENARKDAMDINQQAIAKIDEVRQDALRTNKQYIDENKTLMQRNSESEAAFRKNMGEWAEEEKAEEEEQKAAYDQYKQDIFTLTTGKRQGAVIDASGASLDHVQETLFSVNENQNFGQDKSANETSKLNVAQSLNQEQQDENSDENHGGGTVVVETNRDLPDDDISDISECDSCFKHILPLIMLENKREDAMALLEARIRMEKGQIVRVKDLQALIRSKGRDPPKGNKGVVQAFWNEIRHLPDQAVEFTQEDEANFQRLIAIHPMPEIPEAP